MEVFKFPIVMMDKKAASSDGMEGLGISRDVEYAIGYVELEDISDYIGMTDRWMPSEDSYQRAVNGDFEACNVMFDKSGMFTVPMPRKKFRRLLEEYRIATAPAPKRTVELNPTQVAYLLSLANEQGINAEAEDVDFEGDEPENKEEDGK